MKKLWAVLAFAVALLLGLPAPAAAATTWYFSNCTASAQPGVNGPSFDCVAGAEGNSGTLSTTPKQLMTTAATKLMTGTCAAGDTVLFAQGGSWLGGAAPSVGTDFNWLNCTAASAGSPITIGEYTPSYMTRCTGSGTITAVGAGTMTDSVQSGVWTLDQFKHCDVKVTSTIAGAKYTQRMTLSGNSTLGVATLDSYRDGTFALTNAWPVTPVVGDTYTIVGKAPLISRNSSNADNIFYFGETGQTVDLRGINISGLHLEGFSFARPVTSATNVTNAVITDSGLNSVAGITAGALVGKTLEISGGTCTSASILYTISANTTTTITLSGAITGGGCSDGGTAPDSTSRYSILGVVSGIWTQAYNSDVVIDGVQVSHTELAVNCSAKVANPTAENYIVRNNQFRFTSAGVLWGCDHSLIENNLFTHNGKGLREHHLYMTDGNIVYGLPQVYVRGNRFTDGNIGASGLCGGAAIIKHGLTTGLFFENNFLEETATPVATCWGMGFDSGQYGTFEGFSNFQIRGNTFIGFPTAIGVDITDGAVIENNNILTTTGTGIAMRDKSNTNVDWDNTGTYLGTLTLTGTTGNITVTASSSNFHKYDLYSPGLYAGTGTMTPLTVSGCGVNGYSACTTMTGTVTSAMPGTTITVGNWGIRNTQPKNIIIRNNTIRFTAPSAALGMKLNRGATDGASQGGHRIHSNIIVFGPGATNTTFCFNTDNLTTSDYSIDYNTCYAESAGTPKWDSVYNTLGLAQAAGRDTNSTSTDPGVTVGASPTYTMTITSGSAAYNTGHPTLSSPFTRDGKKRAGTGAPSKGAHEPNATSVLPGAPTRVKIL